MSEDNRPVWEQIDYGQDAIVEASAGTGKTYALEHVVQHLVEKKDVDIRDLLLVTFTEKASGELKERIRGMLSSAKSASAQSALKHLDEATICTIHSFCQELLREYPFESGLQMKTEVVGSDEDVVEKAVRTVMTTQEFKNGEDFTMQMSSWDDSKDVEGLVLAVVKRLKKVVMSGLTPEGLTAQRLNRLRLQLDAVTKKMPGRAENLNPGAYVLQHTNGGQTLGSRAGDNARYQEYFSGLDEQIKVLSNIGVGYEQILRAAQYIASGKVDFKLKAWDGVRPGLAFCALPGMVPYRELKDTASAFCQELEQSPLFSQTVELAYAEYLRLKKRSSSITFDDMVLETSRVVKDAVADAGNAAKQAFLRKIRSRYRIALVDEFQDTDDKQWTIFDSLFSGRVNKLEGANPEQGCLIVVGDPKQAIYRFRGADIDTYLRAKKEILERTNREYAYKLETMYRSTEEMVKAFNAIFKNTKDNSDGWFKDMTSNGLPIEYDEVHFPTLDAPGGVKGFNYPSRDGSENECERAVELLETVPKDTVDAKPNVCLQLFLENMAAEIKRLHESAFWMAREDPKDRMNWNSMCVLAKSHADCEAAQKVLRAKGIPCRQYKEAGLFDSEESESVLALFDYLSMPRSSGNLAALLLTPLFEVSLTEVEKKLGTGTGEVEALCDKWRSYIARCEWVKFFESVMNETALGRPHPGDADHGRHRSGVRQIFDRLLERHGRASELSALTDALRNWRRDESAAGEEGSVRNKESESDAVQIMTMHASKGLEFNAVFVPYGYREMVANRTPTEDKAAEIMEVKRLLYVALTRAKYKLYLPWSKRMEDDSFKEKTALGSVLGAGIRKLFSELYHQDPNAFVLGADSMPEEAETSTPVGSGHTEPAANACECPELPPSRGMKGWRFKWDSFSSMNHHASPREKVVVEGVKTVDDEVHDGREKSESLVPKGALSGTVFHEVMEILCNNDSAKGEVDFSVGREEFASVVEESNEKKSPLLEIVRRRMNANGLVNRAGKTDGESTAVSIARMAWNALRTELCVGGDTFKLCEVLHKDRKAEVNFVLDEGDVVGDGPSREGALNGSIDLIVRRPDGRYCIIDWKTNTLESYDTTSVETAMDEAGYHLQYKLYSYTAEKWLGESAVKGATYLFVRGGEFQPGSPSGVFGYDRWAEERASFARKIADRLAECDAAEAESEKEDL